MDGLIQIGRTFAQEYKKTPIKLKVTEFSVPRATLSLSLYLQEHPVPACSCQLPTHTRCLHGKSKGSTMSVLFEHALVWRQPLKLFAYCFAEAYGVMMSSTPHSPRLIVVAGS